MPLLAGLVKAIALWFAGAASSIMFYVFTVTWAKRLAIVLLGVTFMAAVSTCISGLLSFVSSTSVSGRGASRFLMGLGMFIPSNAVAVMSCLAAVWLACVVYRLKLEAIRW